MSDEWEEDDTSTPVNNAPSYNSYSGGSGGGRGGGGDRPPRESRPGDWDCPNASCGATGIFQNKSACFKCGEAKPEGLGGGDSRPAREPRPGDWDCPACGATGNFKSKQECFKCHEPKPEGLETSAPAREPRPGDWDCPACGATGNFKNKQECFKCSEPKPEGLEPPPREARPGDWDCPACGATGNFKSKTECFKCQEPRPEGLAPPPREPRPGDWECPACKATGNFASRMECFKCKEPKPAGLEMPEGEKPRENYTPADLPEGEELFSDRTTYYEGSGINFDAFDSIPIQASENMVTKSVESFEELNLRPLLLKNIQKVGYKRPTPIQKNGIPVLLNNQDLMACAQTGSGKTAAFLVPILQNLISDSNLDTSPSTPAKPQALIVAPTRELVIQIHKEACLYSNDSIVKVRMAYGGTTIFAQKNKIQSGCNILVATPGRLMQFINERIVDLKSVRFFILDEADRMLDMGFMPDVKKVVDALPAKGERVTAMFSATFPAAIQQAASEFLNNYVFLVIGIVGGANTDVKQEFIPVERNEKRNKIFEILESTGDDDKVLIFCSSKKGADFLAASLSMKKVSSTSIHGDRLQSQRETALREFTTGKRKVLVATAVAARGLDIPKVSLVINYDLPNEVDEYVHRIGRTGRVGHTGRAITFFDSSSDNDTTLAPAIVGLLNDAKQEIPECLAGFADGGGGGANGFGAVDQRGGAVSAPPAAADEEEEW